jgi:hypothetical protein
VRTKKSQLQPTTRIVLARLIISRSQSNEATPATGVGASHLPHPSTLHTNFMGLQVQQLPVLLLGHLSSEDSLQKRGHG